MNDISFGVGQSTPDRLAVLNRLVEKQAQRHGHGGRLRVLEIGSYEGSSALMFSAALATHCEFGGSILCVDPWLPYLPEEDVGENQTCRVMQDNLKAGLVFQRFFDNIRHSHRKAPITFHVGTIKSAIKEAVLGPHGQFDIIYIDGSHAYKDVSDDIRLSWPFLKRRGLMCGDDLERQFPQCDGTVYTYKDREFVDGYHPGVSLAVWEAFEATVWCENCVWAVRKLSKTGKKWGQP